MRSKVLFCCILMFSFVYVHAQPRCGFDVKMRASRRQDPNIEKKTNQQVRQFIINQRMGRQLNSLAAIYYVPVVVHVINTGGAVGTIYNPSDATIISAINYLNAVYDGTWNGAGGPILGVGDVQIKFVLATKDPNGNSTTGIERIDGTVLSSAVPSYDYAALGIPTNSVADEIKVKNLSRWDPERYYNVWVVNKIDGNDGTSGAFVAGYAYFPNAYTTDELKTDGIVMLATQMAPGAKTLPHEIGHAFGLFHVFEGEQDVPGALNNCPNISSSGDDCADTDPVINPADDGYGASAFSCRSGVNPCTSTAYNDNTEKNFMNYTNCYQLFTSDQKTRMLAMGASSNRNSLVTSWANNQGSYPTTWSAPAAATVAPSTGSSYPDFLGVSNVSLNGINIYSLNATEDGGYKDNANWYNLIQLMPNTTYTMDVGLFNSGNYEQLGVWIDYDGNGSFNNTNEMIYYSADNAPADVTSFSFTTPASLSGNIVRMRVMNDFSTRYGGISAINGSTSSLVAGQAEDYPIFLTNTSTLPLKLLEFTGTTRQHSNYLQWKTTNEINTKEFEVQRSINGSDFIRIASVAAAGNTSSESAYHFNDDNQGSGRYIYRLKMVDMNGSFTYSISVNLEIEDPLTVEVMGNPFDHSIKLRIPQNTSVALRLMDASGRTLLQRNINRSNSGLIELPVDPSWSKGIYLLETTINSVKTVHKLIKN